MHSLISNEFINPFLKEDRVAANPTVDDVMRRIAEKVRQGCAPKHISDDARRVVSDRYTQSFQTRLENQGAWDRDGPAVLEAARQLGLIAAAICALRQQEKIDRSMAEHAADVVQEECMIGFGEGRW